MKVVMYDPGHFLPHYMDGICGAIRELGVDVKIVSSRPLFEDRDPADTDDHDFFFFPLLGGRRASLVRHRRILRRAIKVCSYPAGLARTWFSLRDATPAVLHAQWAPLTIFDGRLFRSLKKKGWTIVYTAHDPAPDPRMRRLAAGLYRWMARSADAVVVHTSMEAKTLRDRHPELSARINVIPHGASIRQPATDSDRDASRAAIGLERGRDIILAFGLIKRYKGIEYAIAAMPAILRKFPRALLVIAGEPLISTRGFRNQIAKSGLQKSVVLRSQFIPEKEVQHYFRAADIVVAPYTSIGTSGVVILAQSYGLPVVVTRVGGLPEYVEPNRSGFVVPPRDSRALAEAVCSGLSDKTELAAMGIRGRQSLSQQNSWEQVAEQTLDLYRRASSQALIRGVR